jgi:hypothetical protein
VLHLLKLVGFGLAALPFPEPIVFLLAQRTNKVETGIAPGCRITVVHIILPRLQQVLKHLVEFFGSSRVFGESAGQVMAVVQSPILKHLCALKVSLEHCNFEGIKFFTVHGLHGADIKQIFDDFDVSVGGCVVEHGIVAVISFVVALCRAEEIVEAVVLVVSDGQHERGSAKGVGIRSVLVIE